MAHDAGPYYHIVLDATDCGRTEYVCLDHVRMNVGIGDLADFGMTESNLILDGAAEYVDVPLASPDTAITSRYGDSTHAKVRVYGDLALSIDARAMYSAEGFVDVTNGSPVLVLGAMRAW